MTDQALLGEDARDARSRRTITAPEGVLLTVRLATLAERGAALLLDLLIIGGLLLALALVLFLAPRAVMDQPLVIALLVLISFAVRSFYFAWFELRWRGATPGKRALQLRVVDRTGGPLRGDAVMARNLMREVELFLPLSLLLVLEFVTDARWIIYMALIWIGALALLPVFNRDRLRAGDMLAGTWVIAAPKHALLPDVAARTTSPLAVTQKPDEPPAPDYRFTEKQLAIYGAYELQVLEDVLRRRGADTTDVHRQVADRIRRKTGWQDPDGLVFDPRRFLEAFYRAQRARLETDLSFGKRRRSKRDPQP